MQISSVMINGWSFVEQQKKERFDEKITCKTCDVDRRKILIYESWYKLFINVIPFYSMKLL